MPPPALADVAVFQLVEEPEDFEDPELEELELFEPEPHAAIATLAVKASAAGTARRHWRRTVGTTDIDSPLVTVGAWGTGARWPSWSVRSPGIGSVLPQAPGCLRRNLGSALRVFVMNR
jgi:hypothetical protein